MIAKSEVISYIAQIPSSQQVIQQAIKLLDSNNLEQAGQLLQTAPAIVDYLQKMSRKGVLCIQEKDPCANTVIVFFGSKKTKAILYTYLISTILPKKWQLFDISNDQFFELSATLIHNWERILKTICPNDISKYIAASSLITSSIAICDSIFGAKRKELDSLMSISHIDFSKLLETLTGMSIFDVAKIVGEKLSFEQEAIDVIGYAATAKESTENPQAAKLGKFLHLLLFYSLSRQEYIKTGLNSFLNFNTDGVAGVFEQFSSIVETES